MTNPDYRAMCAELVEALHGHTCLYEGHESELVARARALLAQPEPKGPTDEDVFDLCEDLGFEMSNFEESAGILLEMFRAVLARWGHPTSQPEPEALTDEEIMELMPQQMRDDLAAAAYALAGFYRANVKAAAGLIRITLNRHAVDHVRAALAKWGHQ